MRVQWLLAGVSAVVVGCGDDAEPSVDAADATDVADVADVADVTNSPDADTLDVTDSDVGNDTDADTVTPPPLAVVRPIAPAAADPLAGTGLESCPVYQATRCGEAAATCDIYDTTTHEFVNEPDALVRRAYLYDRWYDLYHRPDGVTAERVFSEPMAAGTPESTWGARDKWQAWNGVGDGAIWTGSALSAAAFRYAASGTEADYARMVERTKDLLRLFDVTGIPGYLARHPFIHMDAGGPDSVDHIVRFGATGIYDYAFDATKVPDMPNAYIEGVPDGDGRLVKGQAMWHGNPSIDQYTGPMVAFPLAWSLLRDDATGADLKARMTRHLTCYLNRLRRVELTNLQQNTEALAAVQQFLAGGNLVLDPGDPDLGKLDTIVAYGLPQPNAANTDTFDASCPDAPTTTASLSIDAAGDDFYLQLLDFVADLSERDEARPNAIDHLYAVSVRGGDASHLMHLAAMAWLMSGDDKYAKFLQDELIGKLHVDQVTHTLGAFTSPPWCRSYYGDHITFGPHWALITLLAPGPLRDDMLAQLDVELRAKLMGNLANGKFALMYASVASADDPNRAALRDQGLALLDGFGGSGGVIDDPRRSYSLDRAEVIAALPEGITTVCPTAAERARCEDGFSVLGLTVPGEPITHDCHGGAGECDMGDGTCADAMASTGLPPTLRRYADFMWQRSPFALGESFGEEGREQSPGLDLVEEFWLARAYGLTNRGHGQVRLARQPYSGRVPMTLSRLRPQARSASSSSVAAG